MPFNQPMIVGVLSTWLSGATSPTRAAAPPLPEKS
jgi:hypothetical protein